MICGFLVNLCCMHSANVGLVKTRFNRLAQYSAVPNMSCATSTRLINMKTFKAEYTSMSALPTLASHCNIDALLELQWTPVTTSGTQVHQTVLSLNTDHMGNNGKLDGHLDHSECICCSVADICLSSNAFRRNVSLLCNVRQVFADLQCHNEPHTQDESVRNVQVVQLCWVRKFSFRQCTFELSIRH